MEILEIRRLLQDAQTTGNGTAVNLDGTQREVTIYLNAVGTVSAGAVQVETADSETYSGTWAPVTASPTTLVTDTTKVVQVTGAMLWIRARISTTITGGAKLTATILAN